MFGSVLAYAGVARACDWPYDVGIVEDIAGDVEE
jgi:hypothetical protein